MGNLKHTMAAVIAVTLVGSLAAVQATGYTAARANKLTQETSTNAPAVLSGDGEGETIDFSIIAPAMQFMAGKDAYILTSGGSINLRSAADTESTILNVLKMGTKVKIIDVDEDWLKVEAGEYTGYIKSEFITLDYSKIESALLSTIMYRRGKVTQSINVRAKADQTSIILAQAAEGSDVIILEDTQIGWYKVYYGDNYDIGYVCSDYIEIGDMIARSEVADARNSRLSQIIKGAKIKTTGAFAEVKLIPSDDSDVIATLPNNTACKVISGGTNWTKIIVPSTNEVGYVKTSNIVITDANSQNSNKSDASTSKNASANGSSLVTQASKYLGIKYVYGGTTPSGFDCSGLVQYCCRKLGVSVSRSAQAQYSNGSSVSKNNLKPGDLVFFSRGGSISHVAIYAGNGQVIHAPRSGKSVCYQSLDTLCGSLKYVGAKRVM